MSSSSSSTNSLTRLYHQNTPPGAANIPELSKALKDIAKEERGGQEGQGGSDEEDDYEPMKPGVMATGSIIPNWEESRNSLLRNDYSSMPKSSSTKTGEGYSMVIVKPPLREALGKRNSTPVNYRPVIPTYPKPGMYVCMLHVCQHRVMEITIAGSW